MLDLSVDFHVHSTFSDGKNTVLENAAAAHQAGIRQLGCVDHVRRDTNWVPRFVAEVAAMQTETPVELIPGIETKLLDTLGNLDMPDLGGLDVMVLVADHRWPTLDGTWSPRAVRDRLADNTVTPRIVADALVQGYVATMRRHGRVVIAHPFSFLPKVGLSEEAIPGAGLREFARTVIETDSVVEVSERWRCPTRETYEFLIAEKVPLVASTDSHRARTIGQYDYVRGIDETSPVTCAG